MRRRRQPVADSQGFCQDGPPSPRSHRYHHHHHCHHLHRGIPPRIPPSASTSRGVSRALAARDSSSFPSSSLSPFRTSASPWTHASCRDRRHPPLPEASRIERQSIPVRAKKSLKKGRRKSRMEAISGRWTYQVNQPLIRPHREAVHMLRLKVACDGRPDSGRNLVARRSLIGQPAGLEIPGRNAGTHLVHPQRPRHPREDPSMMDS